MKWNFSLGGIDRKNLTSWAFQNIPSLIRRYMENCVTWKSSYRFVLAMIQERPRTPYFPEEDLNSDDVVLNAEIREDAIWDVFFTRLSGIQEYGFHSGIETLMWATDQLNGSLTALDWSGLSVELSEKSSEWTDLIIAHATDEGAFFPPHAQWEDFEEFESL